MLSEMIWIRGGVIPEYSRYLLSILMAAALALCVSPSQALEFITYYHNDTLGSPIAATDESGDELWIENYRPFGDRVVQDAKAAGNPLWYTGKPQDSATGLSYYGARYYDPVLGRFMAIDPVGFQDSNLHSFNRYAYANNNPYKFVDPDGEAVVIALFALVAAEVAFDTIFAPDVPFDSGVAQSSTTLIPGPLKVSMPLMGVGSVARGGVDDLLKAGQHADRNGLTKAGRGLQKHGDRLGSVFPKSTGNAVARNQQGQDVLEGILKSGNQTSRPNRFGGKDIFDNNTGRGVRFDADGKMKGFLEP